MFIYLDEGDDPFVWNCSVDEDYDSEKGEAIWKTTHNDQFSILVNRLVERALKRLTPW